ncbi:MAG: PilZ domain-containing protein [Myxococcota bacterium]
MSSIPLLVCCDAGAAGRELLARRDMVLRWALTLDEAKAVFTADPPRLVLVREDMADDILTHLPSGLPAVVLLEPDGWSRRERYAEAGATALVRANNRERILEAVSELTGLSFRVHPRISLEKAVSVAVDGEIQSLEAVEMSGSGIAVRNLSGVRVGSRVTVELAFIDPSVTLAAVVVRFGQDEGQPLAGLAFDDPSGDDRAVLAEYIRKAQSQSPLPEPENLAYDPDTCTLDLLLLQAGADIRMFKDMMSAAMFPLSGAIGPRMPPWLENVAHQLTAIERAALRGASTVLFAVAAIEFRIALAYERAEAGGIVSSDMRLDVIEFSRSLVLEGEGMAPEILLQITEIRAALLIQAYADLGSASLIGPPVRRSQKDQDATSAAY